MIKDKITPEIKLRFLEAINRTKDTGIEEGFVICKDKYGKLSPGKTCHGTDCDINIPPFIKSCPRNNTVQGDFHTHPSMKFRDFLKEEFGRDPTVDEVKNIESRLMRIRHEEIGIKGITSITTPTYPDVLIALARKCANLTNGTTCIGHDLEDNKVECWTPKEIITPKMCKKALKKVDIMEKRRYLGKEVGEAAEKWIMNLFDKELIDLRK